MLLRFDGLPDLDRIFGELRGWTGARSIPLDAYRRGNFFLLHFDLPGVNPDSIELTVDKDVLTVKAERVWKEEEGDDIVVSERRQGTFQRQLFLSDNLDTEHLQARYDGGVLTVRVPLAEAAKPRKIEVKVGEARPVREPKPSKPAADAA